MALASLAGRAALLRWVPIPEPAVTDEFSYLLAGDTFASGRLTNPTHPLWLHFETVHEIMHPSYQSKYPPLQGMLLALGQVLFGHPWFGVWLSMGVMSGTIYWALAGWLPPKWALLGGALAVVQIGFFNYWSDSYWGGAAAAAAGALVIGSVPRLREKPSFGVSLTLAFGLVLLANARPYEGLVLGTACLGGIFAKVSLRQVAGPLALLLIPAGLWMGFYNYRVTGNALMLPYQSHLHQYDSSSAFFWQTNPTPPPYHHESLRRLHEAEQKPRLYPRQHPVESRASELVGLSKFFLGWPWAICSAVLFIPIFRCQPNLRIALIILLIYAVGVEVEVTVFPHYVAPGTALFYILGTAALRHLGTSSRWVFAGVLALVAVFTIWTLVLPNNRWLYDKRDFLAERIALKSKLDRSPGKQLVFVEYGPGHDVNHEWIYNRADIDASRTVWAQTMGQEKDRELVEYFKDRHIWKLRDEGAGRVRLSPE